MRRFAGIGLAVLTLSGCSLDGRPGFSSVGMAQTSPTNPTWTPKVPLIPEAAGAPGMQLAQAPMAAPANPYMASPNATMPGLMQNTPSGVVQARYTDTQVPPTPPNLSDPATMHLISETNTVSKPSAPEVVRSAQPTDPVPAPGPVAEDRLVGVTPALRVVNSPRFTLGYELRDLGTNGLSSLELWTTSDTRSWTRLPTAQFQPSSCTVTVAGEGTYGFTVVSRDGQHPRPGESPQVWVTVDTSKPVVQIQEIDMNLITKPRTLVIRWSAHDRNFGPRPVTISYAEKADGPWMALIANVPNTGHYEVAVPASLPSNLFFRVEATDMAGNVGMATTAQTVQVGPDKEEPKAAVVPPPPPQGPFVSPVSVLGVNPD